MKNMFSFLNSSSNKVFLLLYLPTITSLLIGRSHGQSYDCPNTTSNIFAPNTIFHTNLNHLLSSLSSNANQTDGFYNTTVGSQNDTVYGLFLCRGDLTPATCQDCVYTGTNQIIELCPNLKQAVVLYEQCLLRYSDQNFFSQVKTTPTIALFNKDNVSDQQSFGRVLNTTLNDVVVEAVKSNPKGIKNFGTKEANLSESENLYILAQCTQDLSSQQCEMCLGDIIGDITRCCLERQGGRVMSPSCNVRFELYPFYYADSAVAQSPPSAKGKALFSSRTIIIIVVLLVVAVVMVCCITYYFLITRKRRQNCKVTLRDNFGSEISTLESLQFSLGAIEAATNKFSHQNRIGKGGFGEVYKGILSDGREIAVKRLSKNSGQGEVQFKNEILLIAKLQHRNLVALLGFCLEEEEKILVYEYVTNKSLDYFLFGSQQDIILSWSDRYKIIKGTARGILYLHEHSRLKVIHRDLKPSNILLDDEMNPKISDFGLAKMVAVNETEGSTNRIVGTYGYMSPEYAMLGQYSEKSDIFSFGVIVLEIVSGKKNVSSHDDSQYADGLLSYAWKQWRDDKLSELLDSNLAELGSYNEVIKCIHIGLLCVQENPDARPSMGTIVSYFSNDDVIQMPYPQEPAFFMHGRLEFTIGNWDSSSNQFTSSSK